MHGDSDARTPRCVGGRPTGGFETSDRDRSSTWGPRKQVQPQFDRTVPSSSSSGPATGWEDLLDLVRRAQRGDHDAFDELVDRHAAGLYRLAVAVIGPAEAADATQDALLRAWRELPSLREPDRFTPWLHRILVNRCRDIARAERRRVRLIPVHDLGATSPSIADVAPAADRRADLDRALRRLPVDQRAVLALHYFIGFTLAHVGLVLGVPEGTAKSRLNASLVALRRLLGEGAP